MYTFLLYAHSWLRWIILILALVNIYKSYVGWKGAGEYAKADNGLAAGFVGSIHLMAILGLVLYFFYSPFAFSAFSGSASVMKEPILRYWAVEHVFAMTLAVIALMMGRIKSKKESDPRKKYKIQLVYFSIALVLMLSRIPFNEVSRLFRF